MPPLQRVDGAPAALMATLDVESSPRTSGIATNPALGTRRASVTQDELNNSEDAAVDAAIRVHEWVQREILWLAKAIRDPEHGPSAAQERHADSYT